MMNHQKGAALTKARALAIAQDLRRLAEVERLNAEDIGPRLNLAPATVHKYSRILGINLVRKAHPERNYAKAGWLPIVRRLRAAGKGWDEIGKALGTTRITANRFGIQNGLGQVNPRRSSTGDIY